MPRFVIRYRGKGDPAIGRQKLQAIGASIVEDGGRMFLVEAPAEQPLREALSADGDWVVAPETSYAIPDPRRSIR